MAEHPIPPGDGPDDDDLLRELAAALAEGAATPPSVAAAGRALFAWRAVDAELAELVADSAQSPGGVPVGVRAAPDGDHLRSLSYRGGGLRLDVDVERRPAVLRGRVAPAPVGGGTPSTAPAEVVVEFVTGTPLPAAVDDDGWFSVALPSPQARFRLRCGALVTPWIG